MRASVEPVVFQVTTDEPARPAKNEVITWEHLSIDRTGLSNYCVAANKAPWALTAAEAERFLGVPDSGPRRISYHGSGARYGTRSYSAGWRPDVICAFMEEGWVGMTRTPGVSSKKIPKDEVPDERIEWWEMVVRLLGSWADWDDLGWTMSVVSEFFTMVETDVSTRVKKSRSAQWNLPVGYYVTCAIRVIFHDMAKRTPDLIKKESKLSVAPEDMEIDDHRPVPLSRPNRPVAIRRDPFRPYVSGGVPVRVAWLDLGLCEQPPVPQTRDFTKAVWCWQRLYHGSIWGVAKMLYDNGAYEPASHRQPREVLGLMRKLNKWPTVTYDNLDALSLHEGENITTWLEFCAEHTVQRTVLVVQWRDPRSERLDTPEPSSESVRYWPVIGSAPFPTEQPVTHWYSTKELSAQDPTGTRHDYFSAAAAEREGRTPSPQPRGSSRIPTPVRVQVNVPVEHPETSPLQLRQPPPLQSSPPAPVTPTRTAPADTAPLSPGSKRKKYEQARQLNAQSPGV
jgi:hypothetical protein